MRKETRTIVFDEALGIEAYRLEGIVQPFPNHFHDFFVIGIMVAGERYLCCKGREYILKRGDIVLFQPGDNHACAQSGDGPLDYHAFNIPVPVMRSLAEEITGAVNLPGFGENVIVDEELGGYLRTLHNLVMSGTAEFEKEENLLFLISLLIGRYGQAFENGAPECGSEIEEACRFMDLKCAEGIRLDEICRHVGLSKSTLLRSFTKEKGITPYRYLETVRINRAKKLLEQGVSPIEAGMQTGFSDQSHFTNQFTSYTGLSPGVYREIFLEKVKGETDGA